MKAISATVFLVILVLLVAIGVAAVLSFQLGMSMGGGGAATTTPSGPLQVQPQTRHITLIAEEMPIKVADNITFTAWVFNGTLPAPPIFVNEGDTIVFTLINRGTRAHSIDFHAMLATIDNQFAQVPAGESKSFTWVAQFPGIFMYHCGASPVFLHVHNGMYGAIIVRPVKNPLPPADREIVIVQSELYLNKTANPDGTYSWDADAILHHSQATLVMFNGYQFKYLNEPIQVVQGERVRFYLLNAGPNLFSAMHIIGGIWIDAWENGNPLNHLTGMQTVVVGPSQGWIADYNFPQAGKNILVTHALGDAFEGALALINVQPRSSSSQAPPSSSLEQAAPAVPALASLALWLLVAPSRSESRAPRPS